MRGCDSEPAPGAGFIDTSVPDLQNLLDDLAQGVAASTQEGAIR